MRKFLLLFLLIPALAFAGSPGLIVHPEERIAAMPLGKSIKDTSGLLGTATVTGASAITYIDRDTGLLRMANAERDQLIGTSDQNDDTSWPLTIAVEDETTYVLSTNTSGATITVAEDTATLDGVGSATYGSGNHFVFTCTAAGDVTLSVSGSSTPQAMLEEVPSNLALSSELMPNQVDRDFSGASAWTNGSLE